jgi:hypothetical protein
METKPRLEAKFEKFHTNNPHVWKLFIRFAVQMIDAGHDVLSSHLIINRIRWETSIVTVSDDQFKICNNHIPYYARLWNRTFTRLPQFRTKELTSV